MIAPRGMSRCWQKLATIAYYGFASVRSARAAGVSTYRLEPSARHATPCSGWPPSDMFPLQERTPTAPSNLTCPVCDETSFLYLFVVHGLPIAACRGCGQMALGMLPRAPDFSEYYRHTPRPDLGPS